MTSKGEVDSVVFGVLVTLTLALGKARQEGGKSTVTGAGKPGV